MKIERGKKNKKFEVENERGDEEELREKKITKKGLSKPKGEIFESGNS